MKSPITTIAILILLLYNLPTWALGSSQQTTALAIQSSKSEAFTFSNPPRVGVPGRREGAGTR